MADGHGWERDVTPTTVYQGVQQQGVQHGHEEIDLNIRTVIQWFMAWVLIVAVSITVLWWLFIVWSNYSTRQELLVPNPRFNQQLRPPEPQVLPNADHDVAHPEHPMMGPSEQERLHRIAEDQALQRYGLEDASGQPALPPSAMSAVSQTPRGPLSNGELRLKPSDASGGTALENQIAGE